VQATPQSIRLSIGPSGKPCLPASGDGGTIHFNVSHSEDIALIALSREREVGVDVERVRWLIELDGIAAREFAPAERRALLRATSTERLALFYRYWTLKEAHVKAEGVGLRAALDTVDVSAVTESPVVVRSGWTARTLMCEPGYAAALVVAGRGRYSLALRDFFFDDPQWSSPLTTTDTPPTVETSCSANG
jgi:4'-phosphopantetheinyl transferase